MTLDDFVKEEAMLEVRRQTRFERVVQQVIQPPGRTPLNMDPFNPRPHHSVTATVLPTEDVACPYCGELKIPCPCWGG